MVTLQAVFYTVGAVYIVAIIWLVQRWQMLLLAGESRVCVACGTDGTAAVLPCVASLALMYFLLPESPRFCLVNDRHREAKVVAFGVVGIISRHHRRSCSRLQQQTARGLAWTRSRLSDPLSTHLALNIRCGVCSARTCCMRRWACRPSSCSMPCCTTAWLC